MKRARLILAACLPALASGCFTTTIRNGLPAGAPSVANDGRWHHGVLWGIAEISGPYSLEELCPNGWAEITTETSFLNGLLDIITWSIYSPQSVTVRCVEGEAPAGLPEAAPEAAPPAAEPAAAEAAPADGDLPPAPPPP
jgi:hypothetical protein